jgi:hypothetical protein
MDRPITRRDFIDGIAIGRRAGQLTTPSNFHVQMSADVPMGRAAARLYLADLVLAAALRVAAS